LTAKTARKYPIFHVLLLYHQHNKPLQAMNNKDFNKSILKYTVKNTVTRATLPHFSFQTMMRDNQNIIQNSNWITQHDRHTF